MIYKIFLLLSMLAPQALAQELKSEDAAINFSVTVSDETNSKPFNDSVSVAKVGELVRFDVSASTATSFKWMYIGDTDDFEVYDDGRKAVFSARTPGKYRFVVACAKDGSVDLFTHLVIVESPPSEPVNGTLADWIPYWLYDSGLSRSEAHLLADSFEQTANKITPTMTPEMIINLMADSNRSVMGASLSNWIPLLKKIQVACDKLSKEGNLLTPQQYQSVYLDIAKGLRRYGG